MKAFYMNGDNNRLYFTNYERRPDEEEYKEIMSILKRRGCVVENTHIGPDCDLLECKLGEIHFDVIRTIDGDGTFIYCDDLEGMRTLECLFVMKEEK